MRIFRLIVVLVFAQCGWAHADDPAPTRVIFDTDIGTDIDDAYALVALLHRPDLHLIGVTTVSADAVARARLAAKLLSIAGGDSAKIPVYAGVSTAPQYMDQVKWATGFSSPVLHESGGVEFMREQVEAHPGEVTLIAVGELTNIAALLQLKPGIGGRIRAIALMGGAIHRGYEPGSKPAPEWNIRSNVAAARIVFASGVPLLVAPLDSTMGFTVTPEMRVRIFARGTGLTDALAALNSIWRHTNTWGAENPTLFDVLPLDMVGATPSVKLTPMHIEVSEAGLTQPIAGRKPNAQVALSDDSAARMKEIIDLITR
jgi:inosine-uridine nucleoside N-ribohydrolase